MGMNLDQALTILDAVEYEGQPGYCMDCGRCHSTDDVDELICHIRWVAMDRKVDDNNLILMAKLVEDLETMRAEQAELEAERAKDG